MRTYVITLGYDEKFALRFLLRHPVEEGDKVYIVMPEGGDEKVLNAFRNLNKLVDGVKPIELNLDRPVEEVSRISRLLAEETSGDLFLCLSGGMRAVVVITLLAAQKLVRETTRRAWLEIEFENLSGYMRMPLNVITLPRNERYLKILKAIRELGKTSIRNLSLSTGIPITTVHRELRRMIAAGLVSKDLNLTEEGWAYLKLYSD